jgi:hypothetical protein
MPDGTLRLESNESMTSQAYQNAYDTAVAELSNIAASFEQLRARKSLVENAIHALEPFFASTADAAPQVSAIAETDNKPVLVENAAADGEPPQGYSFQDVPSPLPDISETGGDPFQRRGKSSFRLRGFAMQRSF